ncbi:MAG: hypothetical protein R3181_06875 [Rubricoccaceae bacterium]|nr:hypothetical protein [Rubricoccaceae bacterium]
MRFVRFVLSLILIGVLVGLLYVFLTGGLPHRAADGVLAPAPGVQPDTGPARSMEQDVLRQEEVVRDFMDSVPSGGGAAP